jgi:hypothetical protein
MKKLVLIGAVLAMVATPAMAGIIEVSAVKIGEATGGPRECLDCETVYENLDAIGYYTTTAGYDDYQIAATPTCPDWPADMFEICNVQFIGGVVTLGDQLNLTWFDSALQGVIGFNWTPSQAGNFLWTLTFTDPECPSGIFVPRDGVLQISSTAEPPVPFNWYAEATSAEIGTENIALYGPSAEHSWTFAFNGCVPEPGTLALLGIGALALIRRR